MKTLTRRLCLRSITTFLPLILALTSQQAPPASAVTGTESTTEVVQLFDGANQPHSFTLNTHPDFPGIAVWLKSDPLLAASKYSGQRFLDAANKDVTEIYPGQFRDYENQVWGTLKDIKKSKQGALLLEIFQNVDPVYFLAESQPNFPKRTDWRDSKGNPSKIKVIIHPVNSGDHARPAAAVFTEIGRLPLGSRSSVGLNIDSIFESSSTEAANKPVALHNSGKVFHELRHAAGNLLGMALPDNNFASYEYSLRDFDNWKRGRRIPAEELATFGAYTDKETYRAAKVVRLPAGKLVSENYKDAQNAAEGEGFDEYLTELKKESDKKLEAWKSFYDSQSKFNSAQLDMLDTFERYRSELFGLNETFFMEEKGYPRRLLYQAYEKDGVKYEYRMNGRKFPEDVWTRNYILENPDAPGFFSGAKTRWVCGQYGWDIQPATVCTLDETSSLRETGAIQLPDPWVKGTLDQRRGHARAIIYGNDFKKKLLDASGGKSGPDLKGKLPAIYAVQKLKIIELAASLRRQGVSPPVALLASAMFVNDAIASDPELAWASNQNLQKIREMKSARLDLHLLNPVQIAIFNDRIEAKAREFEKDPALKQAVPARPTAGTWDKAGYNKAFSRANLQKFVHPTVNQARSAAGLGLWAYGLATTLAAPESTDLDKAAAVLGLVPILGDVMNVSASLEKAEAERVAFSLIALGFSIVSMSVPVVGDIFMAGMAGSMLVGLVVDAIFVRPGKEICDANRDASGFDFMAVAHCTMFGSSKPKQDPDSWEARCNGDVQCYVKAYVVKECVLWVICPINSKETSVTTETAESYDEIPKSVTKKDKETGLGRFNKYETTIRKAPNLDNADLVKALACAQVIPAGANRAQTAEIWAQEDKCAAEYGKTPYPQSADDPDIQKIFALSPTRLFFPGAYDSVFLGS
ncbi:hypothetical protein [Streptomyces virginiae]|uniref:hypothetical protein n=1 Tax=Streptomyces virginiae TaxID=1961 RepID=UPI00332BD1D1